MAAVETCPHCSADLRGEQIPEEYLRAGYYGEWDGVTPRFYSRAVLVELRGVYDGGLFYACPDCGGRWHRWPVGHYLRARAERWINAPTVGGVA